METFSLYWPFVRGIHRWPVNSPHKGQWRGALMFSLICDRINSWVNNREADDLRCHRAHYCAIVMYVNYSEYRLYLFNHTSNSPGRHVKQLLQYNRCKRPYRPAVCTLVIAVSFTNASSSAHIVLPLLCWVLRQVGVRCTVWNDAWRLKRHPLFPSRSAKRLRRSVVYAWFGTIRQPVDHRCVPR